MEPKASNITWHAGEITPAQRLALNRQRGATLWMTGLSGSGKSTIAAALEHRLLSAGWHAYRLDGDNLRHGLNANLGFTPDDRRENIRRLAHVARLFADSGCFAITSFISPYRADRAAAREIHRAAGLPFLEIYVHCPLEEAERRDPKGLYRKARAGEIRGFTGVDDPYEEPQNAELTLETARHNVGACVEMILRRMEADGLLTRPG